MKPKSARVEKRELETLLPFPKQADYFRGLPDHDLLQLADDIERNGLRQLIEILPANKAGYKPNTILRGHQRQRALTQLGRKTVDVLVRYDLANATVDEIDRVFLEDNQNRRQLEPFEKAKIGWRLMEIEKGKRLTAREVGKGEIRDRIGELLKMSGRNLDRYLNILLAPAPVQNAFRAKKLTLVVASRVAGLEEKVQKEIAAQIENGEDARTVIARYLSTTSANRQNWNEAFRKFRRSLAAAHDKFAGSVDCIADHVIKAAVPDLRKGRRLIRAFQEWLKTAPEREKERARDDCEWRERNSKQN